MRNTFRILIAALAASLISGISFAQIDKQIPELAADSINRYMSTRASVKARIEIKSLYKGQSGIEAVLSKAIVDYPLRQNDLDTIEDIIRSYLPREYKGLPISLTYNREDLSRLVTGRPFRTDAGNRKDKDEAKSRTGWIIPEGEMPTEGLAFKNIALWAGHGYYYSKSEDRWKWQRAPFFSTIEDLLPQSYVTSFLAPMLENAGAYVLMPRERDPRPTEIIVDNGDSFYGERSLSDKSRSSWKDAPGKGFAHIEEIYTSGVNPFTAGTARMTEHDHSNSATATYFPYFPETGDYAVYVSYVSLPESSSARYTVRYYGGEKSFTIDQRIGGGTWVYLGTFRFSAGETGQGVIVSGSNTKEKGVITTDAVKFGGGTGNIARGGETSGMPRYAEGARYWLQWSGYPEEIYHPCDEEDDYKDDFMSRGEWVNYMKNELDIPIDLAFALHTDAGSCLSDSIIGTLAIYKEVSDGKSTYPDGRPRITAREYADRVQTQIVEDIRASVRADWTRRAIWDRSYMEARVPEVPTVLIELLSHQNFPDMRLALDPSFKFIVSRAIYKGMLKYISYTSGTPYTVQPLPVKDFSAEIISSKREKAALRLTWSPRTDPLEATATPDAYIVYRRITDPESNAGLPGFDNGVLVTDTTYTDYIESGMMYSYKIVAVNKGGRSFPSEILSAGYIPGARTALVVNGFTDVTPPAAYSRCDSAFAGFNFTQDHGIPYIQDCSYIGEQYEYDRQLPWIHDDRPGFGASYMDYGPAPVAGNTFDYPAVHGLALMRAGTSFCSTSLTALYSGRINPSEFDALDLIFGKKGGNILDRNLQRVLENYLGNGGSLIISGANIGKTAFYDENRTYPGEMVMQSAISYMDNLLKELESLKDSIGDTDDQLSGRIEYMAETIRILRNESKETLSEGIRELHRANDEDFIASTIASDLLKYQWSNSHATSSGNVKSVESPLDIFADTTIHADFRTSPDSRTYCVESPDAIIPSDEDACTIMRYDGSNTSAAVAYMGHYRCIAFGFPIEALTSQQQVDDLLREVMSFLFE